MNVQTLIPPTVEPVTLEMVYQHLRLTTDAGSPRTHPDDDMLLRQIVSARQDCENRTRRAFVKQKLRATFNSGDGCWPRPWRRLELPRPPLISIVSVSYYDASGGVVEVEADRYEADAQDPASLRFFDSVAVPYAYGLRDALRVDYWAGYAPSGSPEDDFVLNVPEPIKSAILLGVELQYEALDTRQREVLEKAQASLLVPYTSFLAV